MLPLCRCGGTGGATDAQEGANGDIVGGDPGTVPTPHWTPELAETAVPQFQGSPFAGPPPRSNDDSAAANDGAATTVPVGATVGEFVDPIGTWPTGRRLRSSTTATAHARIAVRRIAEGCRARRRPVRGDENMASAVRGNGVGVIKPGGRRRLGVSFQRHPEDGRRRRGAGRERARAPRSWRGGP